MSDTTGKPETVAQLQEAGRLVGRGGGDRPGHVPRVVGDHPDGPALDPGKRGHHLAGEARPQERHRTLVGQRLDDRADIVGTPGALRNHCAQSYLVGGGARRGRTLEVSQQLLGDGDGVLFVGDDHVDHPVGLLHRDGADLVGVDVAEPAAGDHGRTAHPDRGVVGGHDEVRAPRDDGIARETAALDDRDPRHHTRQLRPQLECPGIERRDGGIVRVARPAAATFGEEDGGQPHPFDQIEEAVLLAVPEETLSPGEHGVVVGQHRAGAAVAEKITVDPRGARHQPVGGCPRDQVIELAAEPLGGDGEPAVFDERARVDEVVDVLAGGASVRGVPALDCVGPRRVLGQRTPA